MAKRGNPNPTGSKPDKLMRDALMVALKREAKDAKGKKTQKLYLIANKMVDMAVEGDGAMIREIFDRADGKAAQPITNSKGGDLFENLDVSKLSDDEFGTFKQLLRRAGAVLED